VHVGRRLATFFTCLPVSVFSWMKMMAVPMCLGRSVPSSRSKRKRSFVRCPLLLLVKSCQQPWGPWGHFPHPKGDLVDPIPPGSAPDPAPNPDEASSSTEVTLEDAAHEGAVVETWTEEDNESMVTLLGPAYVSGEQVGGGGQRFVTLGGGGGNSWYWHQLGSVLASRTFLHQRQHSELGLGPQRVALIGPAICSQRLTRSVQKALGTSLWGPTLRK
jgi:hypothetical protein